MFPSSKQAIQEMICYSATAMAQWSQQGEILKIHIQFSNFICIYLGSQKKKNKKKNPRKHPEHML